MDKTQAEIKAQKDALRSRIRAWRKSLDADFISREGEALQSQLLQSAIWQKGGTVALYVSLPGEAPTGRILERAWADGREVLLPRLRPGKTGIMDFVPCSGAGQLRPGPMGLLEPDASIPGLEAADPAFAPDFILIPGMAFDLFGRRLGYGAGYYDRYLENARPCPLVGFCFSAQIVPQVPAQDWDQKMNFLCTEKGLQCL